MRNVALHCCHVGSSCRCCCLSYDESLDFWDSGTPDLTAFFSEVEGTSKPCFRLPGQVKDFTFISLRPQQTCTHERVRLQATVINDCLSLIFALLEFALFCFSLTINYEWSSAASAAPKCRIHTPYPSRKRQSLQSSGQEMQRKFTC